MTVMRCKHNMPEQCCPECDPTKNKRVSRTSELTGSVHKALEEAVSAIYFDDSSDYRTSLMAVVRHLDPEIYDLMVVDRRAAFVKLSEQNVNHEPRGAKEQKLCAY